MAPATIASVDDLRAIERAGPRAWMRFDQVHDALADVAARFSDRPALTALAAADDPSPRRWTYVELLAEIRRCANLFRDLAGRSEPRVALLLPPLPEAWFALWGAETAGVACPINHALTDDHLVALLNTADVNLVVTLVPGHAAGDIGARVLRLRGHCPALQTVLTVGGAVAGTLDFACGACPARRCRAGLRATRGAGPRRGAVPHRRHHRAAQAGAAHPRQPAPCGLGRGAAVRRERARRDPERLPALPRRRGVCLRAGAAAVGRPRSCCRRPPAGAMRLRRQGLAADPGATASRCWRRCRR